MLELSAEERASLAPYEFQNTLIEWATKKKDHVHSALGFDNVYNAMLIDLRTNPAVWIKDSPMHKKVIAYLRRNNLRPDLW